jgi:hypothetical protein
MQATSFKLLTSIEIESFFWHERAYLSRARATYNPAEAGFGGCYVSIVTLDNHKNNIKSNRGVLQN